MGNFTSCCIFNNSITPTATVLINFQPNQVIKQVSVPITAGELMLDEPGHAVSPMEELQQSGYVKAMRADDEILAGKVYVLVPFNMVHCKVSVSEKRKLVEFVDRSKRRRRDAKVLPAVPMELSNDQSQAAELKEEEEEESSKFHGSGLRKRYWSPALEPVLE